MSPTVVFETLWANPADGWAIAARAYTRAMLAAGWRVHLKSPVQIFSEGLPLEVRRFLPLERPTQKWDAYIFSCPLGGLVQMKHVFDALEATRKPRMFYTMFERTEVAEDIGARLEKLDGGFVPCIQNGLRLSASCRKEFWTMPLPYFDDDEHFNFPKPRREPRVFAWHGRWEPRKAPDRLLRAFMRAFKPSEAELIIKVGPVPWERSPYPTPEETIDAELDSHDARTNGWTKEKVSEKIRIVRDTLSYQAMLELEAKTDVYVSPSRGEGIDLPAFNARLAGRRLVITESGGPEDIVHQDDVVVRATDLRAPAPEYEWLWGPNAFLIDYPLSDLVSALQEARGRRIVPRERLQANRADRVSKRLGEWLEACLKSPG